MPFREEQNRTPGFALKPPLAPGTPAQAQVQAGLSQPTEGAGGRAGLRSHSRTDPAPRHMGTGHRAWP